MSRKKSRMWKTQMTPRCWSLLLLRQLPVLALCLQLRLEGVTWMASASAAANSVSSETEAYFRDKANFTSSVYYAFPEERAAFAFFLQQNLSSPMSIQEGDLQMAISRGWWALARELVLKTHEFDVDVSSPVRTAVAEVRRHADDLIRLLNKKHNEIAVMSPAFQWAQSPEQVFLNIKFAFRWSSPGALSVENEVIRTEPCCFYFSGIGTHSHVKKQFVLELDLFDDLNPDDTKWSFASVGKVFVTLQKKRPGVWKELTRSSKKLANMAVWWDMKEKYQKELDSFEKDSKQNATNSESSKTNTTGSVAAIAEPSSEASTEGASAEVATEEEEEEEGLDSGGDESEGGNDQKPLDLRAPECQSTNGQSSNVTTHSCKADEL